MDDFLIVIASFFANEFSQRIVPGREKLLDEFVFRYREEIDKYVNSFCLFATGTNPFYDEVMKLLYKYANGYKFNFNQKSELMFTERLCTPAILSKMSFAERYVLFKQYIIRCVKMFQVVIIGHSAALCELFHRGTILDSVKTKITNIQNEIRDHFHRILVKEQFDTHAKTSLIEQGVSPESYEAVNTENQVLSQTRELLEEYKLKLQRAEEINQKLREEIIQLSLEKQQVTLKEEDKISSEGESEPEDGDKE